MKYIYILLLFFSVFILTGCFEKKIQDSTQDLGSQEAQDITEPKEQNGGDTLSKEDINSEVEGKQEVEGISGEETQSSQDKQQEGQEDSSTGSTSTTSETSVSGSTTADIESYEQELEDIFTELLGEFEE